jgi:hypothetical protein
VALSLKRSHELAPIYEASQGGVRQGGSSLALAPRQATPLGMVGPLGVALFLGIEPAHAAHQEVLWCYLGEPPKVRDGPCNRVLERHVAKNDNFERLLINAHLSVCGPARTTCVALSVLLLRQRTLTSRRGVMTEMGQETLIGMG